MKTILLSITILLCSSLINAQSILFFEDLETGGTSFSYNSADLGGASGSSGVNEWVVNDDYLGGNGSLICLGFPFNFSIPGTPAQSTAISNSNNNYAHILADAALSNGIACASFQAADGLCVFDESNFMKMNSDISTLGLGGVTLDFWWVCGGGASIYGEVYYSIDGGSNWTLASPTQYNSQVVWDLEQLSNSVFDNQAQLRFAWRFVNQTAVAAQDPGFAIDDIRISANCQSSSSTITVTACDDHTSPSGSYIYTSSGIYVDTIANVAGCDSIISIDLTINSADASASQNGVVLTANAMGAVYQWLDCSNAFAPIPSANGQVYNAIANGSYAVQVSQNSCVDTSACFSVTGTTVLEHSNATRASIYPNPSNGRITMDLGSTEAMVQVQIYSTHGVLIQGRTWTRVNSVVLSLPEPKGLYMILIKTEKGLSAHRVIRD